MNRNPAYRPTYVTGPVRFHNGAVTRIYDHDHKNCHIGAFGNGVVVQVRIPHGKHSRMVDVVVSADTIFELAEAFIATAGHACDSRGARIADAVPGRPNVGHALWHLQNPEDPMPCIDHSTVIETQDATRLTGEVIDVEIEEKEATS